MVIQLFQINPTLVSVGPKDVIKSLYADADLIVFPEFWTTTFEPKEVAKHIMLAEDFLEPFLEWQKENPEVVLCTGTTPILDHGKVYNRGFTIHGDEKQHIAVFNKQNLFAPMQEEETISYSTVPNTSHNIYFKHNNNIAAVNHAVCFDLRFPDQFKAHRHITIVPAQWPLARIELFDAFVRVRAAESRSLVISANAFGHSRIYGPQNEDTHYAQNNTKLFDIIEIAP